MKIVLTKECQDELTRINNLVENEDYDYCDDMNDDERLVADAGMYEDECYCDNEFDDIYNFAINACEEEGIPAQQIVDKLNLMVKKGLITIE